jgi:phosphoserine phosphatase
MNNSNQLVCTFVSKNKLDTNSVVNFFSKIQNTNHFEVLSKNALDLYCDPISLTQEKKLRNFCFKQKIDICIQKAKFRKKKIFFSDMDATIIHNESLDDLVKMAGIKIDIDKTTKLSMNGKIGIKKTLDLRVGFLKNKKAQLIKRVLRKIKFTNGAEILIKTLNKKKYYTVLITGGFEPISNFVAKYLGFKKFISNRFIIKNEYFTGKYIPLTNKKNSKFFFFNKICKQKKVNKKFAVAIGDGSNDLMMLKAANLGVGYNAHKIIKDNIANQIQFTDISTLLFYLGFKKQEFIY